MSPSRNTRRLAPRVASFLLALSSLPVWGQEVPESPSAEAQAPKDAEFSEEMTVTATRRPENIATIPGSVTVVTREELETYAQSSQRNLGDTLGKLVPGLSPGSQSASTFGQTLRGRNVLVLIDGAPQSSLRSVQHDLLGIDLSTVERIEVVRGTTAIYGEGSSGGIINIITRTPQGDQGLKLTTDFQMESAPQNLASGLGGTISQSLDGTLGKTVSYGFTGSFSRTGGYFDAEGDRIPADPHGQGGLADTNAFNLFGKVGVRLAPEQRLRFSANYYQGRQDTRFTSDPTVGAMPPLSQKARALDGLELSDPQGTSNMVLSLTYDHDQVLSSTLRAQLYHRDHESRFFPFDGRPYPAMGGNIVQSRLSTRKTGGRLEMGTPLPFGLDALWGLDASLENTSQPVALMDAEVFTASSGRAFQAVGEDMWVPPMDVASLSLFTQLEWKALSVLSLRAGVRYERTGLNVDDYNTLAGDAIEGASLSFNRALFNAGVVVGGTQGINAFANFSQGYSLPDVGLILRGAPAGSSVATLNTAPQAVDLVEVGVRGNWQSVQSSLSLYYNRSDLGTSSGGLNAPVVRAPERVYGMEATVDVQPVERLSLGTTFTWLEGQLDKLDDGNYTFLNSYRIPPLKLTGTVQHETLPGWNNMVQLVFSGHRNRFPGSTAYGEREVNSYFTLDLSTSLKAGPGQLRVSVANLLNRQYYTRESQLLRTGANDSYAAARGAVLSAGYTVTY